MRRTGGAKSAGVSFPHVRVRRLSLTALCGNWRGCMKKRRERPHCDERSSFMAFNVRLGDIHAGALTVLPLGIIGLESHREHDANIRANI
jgi:hypothetical protein